MFENLKTARKVRKFRKYNSELVEFNPGKHTVKVRNGKTTIEVSFRLMYFDALYVAFSGDGVCKDAECLARISELLWNTEFPMNFPKLQINALVEQVRKVRLRNMLPEEASEEQAMENGVEGVAEEAMTPEMAETIEKDEILQKELNRKIYFSDLHDFIMGNPNEVRITLCLTKPIDR